jgi:hypothetical protein
MKTSAQRAMVLNRYSYGLLDPRLVLAGIRTLMAEGGRP